MRWIWLFLFFSIFSMDQTRKKPGIKRSLSALISPRKKTITFNNKPTINQRQKVQISCNAHLGQIRELAAEHYVIVENQDKLEKQLGTLQKNILVLITQQKHVTDCNTVMFICFCAWILTYINSFY